MSEGKLPSGWSRVKFGDVVRNVNETSRNLVADGLDRVVGLDHLDPGSLRLMRWDRLADLPDGTTFTRKFKPGQVLFGKRRAYQRKVAVPHFSGVCSGDILVFEPVDKRMTAEFLPYVVQSDGFFDHALGTSAGSLSPRTKWAELARYEFALPPIAEQEKIGEMLSTIRLKMSSINRLHTAIEQVQEALVNKFLITSSKGIETSLGDFADVNPGASHRSAVEGFIPMDAVPIGGRYPTYVEPVNGRSGTRAMAGDVLLARITPCLENGKVCQVPEQYKMIGGSTELLSIRTKGKLHQDLLYHWARSKRIRRLAEEKMSGTTGRLRLGGKELASLPLRVEFGTDLSQLLKRLEALESLKVAQQDSAQSLSAVYRASLNSALAGGQ